MNVLHVIAGMDPKMGGVCQAVRTIVAGLAELGVHSEVVSLDAPDASFIAHDSFPIHALGPAKGPWGYSEKLMPWLLDNFRRFDCIIAHGLWLYPTYAVEKALRRYKSQQPGAAPTLYVMPHGMLDPYFQRAAGRRLKAMRNWAYWKLIEGRVINNADGVLFTCEAERLLAREPFRPYQPKREVVVGLGVEEPPVYTPSMREAFLKHCPQLEDQPYLLFLSRIHEKKGVDLLLDAYLKTSVQVHGVEAKAPVAAGVASVATLPEQPRLIVAGPGLETSYGQQMQQVASKTKEAQAAILFPGMLSGLAKWGAFYHCEAFVLPSHQENFGIAVVEALACSKPVIISNQVNIWREIEGAGGGIVTDDTPTGVEEGLRQWQQMTQAQKLAMGQKAHDCFVRNFATGPAATHLLEAISYKK
ncbi:glycosyltransferase [Hymenobacter crusticola]|uniref:Glycosyl transferase family 1 n=1 Tax=Hymenobacter crusticola TaxID=1770526 RepID=A0A243WDZ8_9BACT|nr:glycosyltransferase [Hymenobacter crusticola]OUJ73883.1 glycosyl transferase family 1 [Hymenobacter crusticola]